MRFLVFLLLNTCHLNGLRVLMTSSAPIVLWALCLLASNASAAFGQAQNLLRSQGGDDGIRHWRATGNATFEEIGSANPIFVVRHGGSFALDGLLRADAVGQYAVLMAWASSERINADGSITDLPYLYGYMQNSRDRRIYAYLQGQRMRSSARVRNEFVPLWGIFRIPDGTDMIAFFLNQASRKGDPHDGSAARFVNPGLYVFATEVEARTFVGFAAPVAPDQLPPASEKSKCLLKIAEAPEIGGVNLGMSLHQLRALFQGTGNDLHFQNAQAHSRLPENVGVARLGINPHAQFPRSEFSGITKYFIECLDGSVFSLRVQVDGPKWKSADEFIAAFSERLNLPPGPNWEGILGVWSKYLRCDGFEIRFFASHDGATNYISVINLEAEKEILRRREQARGVRR